MFCGGKTSGVLVKVLSGGVPVQLRNMSLPASKKASLTAFSPSLASLIDGPFGVGRTIVRGGGAIDRG